MNGDTKIIIIGAVGITWTVCTKIRKGGKGRQRNELAQLNIGSDRPLVEPVVPSQAEALVLVGGSRVVRRDWVGRQDQLRVETTREDAWNIFDKLRCLSVGFVAPTVEIEFQFHSTGWILIH